MPGATASAQLQALGRIAERHGLHTLLIREPATIAWLLGCRYHVPNTLDAACFDVIVSNLDTNEPALSVVSNNIEAPRLRDTEFTAETAPTINQQIAVAWWEDRSTRFPSGVGVGTDRPWADAKPVSADLAAARTVLTEQQEASLATIGADAAKATTRAARNLAPGMTEYEAAAALAAELLATQLEPVVLMVAADGRDRIHRHPLPTAMTANQSFLLVTCARRHGLIASVTRAVVFGSRTDDLSKRLERHSALLRVEQAFLDASVPGARLGDVVQAGVDAYALNGFAADEWTRHHQGGLTGVMPREFPAFTSSDLVLQASMAVAWNPSGDGCKVEDTSIVTAAGVRPVVSDAEWPQLEVGGRLRPGILVQ
jgi:Xaa-Pro dipeptidase